LERELKLSDEIMLPADLFTYVSDRLLMEHAAG